MRIGAWATALLFVASVFAAPAFASPLTSLSTTPNSTTAHATTSYTFGFTIVNTWGKKDLLEVTFPSGYTFGAIGATITGAGAGATVSASRTGQVVTLSRNNDGSAAGGGTAITATITNLINPSTTGSSGTFAVRTVVGSGGSSGTTIDSGVSPAVTITAGAAPTTTDSESGTVGTNGWFRSTITVTFTCTPASGSACSGTKYTIDGGSQQTYTAAFTVSGDLANHQVTYFSTADNGGIESTKSKTLKIDATAPTACTGSYSGTLGTNGWYTAAGSESLTGADATSGAATISRQLDGGASTSYAGPFVITGDSAGHTVSCFVTDNAGNSATLTASNSPVKVDSASPTTTATPSGTLGTNGWYVASPVTITVGRTDATSGIAATTYKVDAGANTPYTVPFTVSGDGSHTVKYWSSDNAGNAEPDPSTIVKIDTTKPAVSAPASCALSGLAGWCRGTVTVTTSASDATSGIASQACKLDGATVACGSIPVASQGSHTVFLTATDNAGNSANVTTAFKIDSIAPSLATTPSCANVGSAGWCRGTVNISTTATDGGSGLAAGSPACTLDAAPSACAPSVSSQGSHTFVLNAADAAGNSATDTTLFKIDSVQPDVSLDPRCATPGSPGWCRSASFNYTGLSSDATAGLAPGSPSCLVDALGAACSGTVTGQGAHHVELDSSDNAGNFASVFLHLAIDSIAPSLSAPAACSVPGDAGWCRGAVDVTPTASDGGSGLAPGYPACTLDGPSTACTPTHVTADGAHSFGIGAFDAAGNSASTSTAFKIDATPPTLAPHGEETGEAGSGAGAHVTYLLPLASDAMSGAGIVTCDLPSGSLFPLGISTVTCHVQDAAGNSATSNFTVHVVDTTAPSVDVHGPVTAEATGAEGAVVAFTVPVSHDLVDGNQTSTCSPPSGSTFPLGPTSVTCFRADAHGNNGSSSFLVTVQDTTRPAIAPHSDVTAEALSAAGAPVDFVEPETFDLVDGLDRATCTPGPNAVFALGDTTITCDAVDQHGNHALQTNFTISVLDRTAPVISFHADVIAEATSLAGAAVNYTRPSTSDAVDGAGNATCAPAFGSQFSLGDTSVLCDATDAHGNHALETNFTVTVQDTTAPVIAIHFDETREATSTAGAQVIYTAPGTSDAVDGAGNATCVPASGHTFGPGDTGVDCDAVDTHGNAALSTHFQVHVIDTTAPVIDFHPDVPAEAASANGTNVPYDAPAVHDILDGASNATCVAPAGSLFPIGNSTVDCDATDAHGNHANQTHFHVIVADTTGPIIDAHANVTAEATSMFGAIVSYFSPNTTDAVDAQQVATCSLASGSQFPLGDTIVHCDATDAHGNQAIQTSFVVHVVDTTSPIIGDHAAVDAEATGPAGATVNYTSPATSDDVDGAGVATCAPPSGTNFALGNTTVLCQAIDSHGNHADNTTFPVHVLDRTPPIIAGHEDVLHEADNASGAVVTYASSATFDLVDLVGTASCLPASGSLFALGNTTIACNARDAHGNPAIPTLFVVRVVDTTRPIISHHGNESREATGAAGANVTYSSPGTLDAVDGLQLATCVPASGSLFPLGSTTVLCNAVDAHGNHANQTDFLVTVVDTSPPVITPHGDEEREATSGLGATVTYTDPATSDIVDGAGVASCSPASASPFPVGDTTVNCHANDAHHNAAIQTSFIVRVLDRTPPTIGGHPDVVAEATSAAGAIVAYDSPSTSDLVDPAGAASCAPLSGSQFQLGNTTVLCDAMDAHGNAANQTHFTVSVLDRTAPQILPHLDETLEANGSAGATVAYIRPMTSDAVDASQNATCVAAPGSLFAIGNTTVLCDATDAAGNHAIQTSFVIHIVDTTAPIIAAHPNVTVEATTGGGATVDYANPATWDTVDLPGVATCAAPSGTQFGLGESFVHCNAVDSHGNSATQTQFTVKVQDTTAPVISSHGDVIAEATGGAGAAATYLLPSTGDAVDGAGNATCAPASGSPFSLGNTTVLCDAVDVHGNHANQTHFIVQVIDTIAPLIEEHREVHKEAGTASGAIVTYTSPAWSDDVDGAGLASCLPASGSLFPLGETIVDCDAIDGHGNHAIQTSFPVHVVDTTGPVIADHATVTQEAAGASGAIVTYTPPNATDDVDPTAPATCGPASGSLLPIGETIVDCDAEDAHHNHAVQTHFLIHVVDTTPPSIASHPDMTAEATGTAGAHVDYTPPATSDIVDGAGNATCAPASGSLFPLGNTTVNCNAMDLHTNSASQTSFVVHVVDTTRPTIDAHGDVTREAAGAGGATVIYMIPATHDVVDGPSSANCLPASGSVFVLGDTSVTCSKTDAHGNAATPVAFVVHVLDTTPPTIGAHADVTQQATGPSGAVVTFYAPTTSDLVDGPGLASCAPASGSLFALGDMGVTCSKTDAHGNAASPVTFHVHVVDTTAPIIDAHAAVVAEAESPLGAHVLYTEPLSHDAVDLDQAAACLPARGTLFPMGLTTVACNKTDAHGNAAAATSFSVTVVRRATQLAYTGATSGQYSDKPVLSAVLRHVGDGAPIAGKSILLTLGSQSVSATTDTLGVASATLTLNQPTGAYVVSAVFAGDALLVPASASAGFALGREDAVPSYTGDTLAPVGTPLSMRATVFESAAAGYVGPNPEAGPSATIGDITKMWVEFDTYAFTGCGVGDPAMKIFAPVLDTGVVGDGIGTASASLPSPGGEATYCVIPKIVAGSAGGENAWYDPDPVLVSVVNFYTNTGQFVTGGGWILDPHGEHDNFGFTARSNKGGQAQGQMVFVRRGTYNGVAADFIIKSNSLGALSFSSTTFPIKATLEGKCTIKVNRQSDGASLASNPCTFTAAVNDVDKGTGSDTYGLTVYDGAGLLYLGLSATALQGGNVVVHNPK